MTDVVGDLANNYALITQQGRSIGTLIPDVTVREITRDTMTVTDQPVQTGSTISDHAFRNPVVVQLEVAWSDSSGDEVGRSRDMYNAILALQKSRALQTITTGKRVLSNMLLGVVGLTTDERTENSLFLTIDARELITVKIGGGGFSGGSGGATNAGGGTDGGTLSGDGGTGTVTGDGFTAAPDAAPGSEQALPDVTSSVIGPAGDLPTFAAAGAPVLGSTAFFEPSAPTGGSVGFQ